jgi:hypothetical protein
LADNAKAAGKFDPTLDLNLDTLRAFLDFSFPNHQDSPLKQIRDLLEHLKALNLTTKDLVGYATNYSDLLSQYEEALFDAFEVVEAKHRKLPKASALYAILILANDDYFAYLKKKLSPSVVSTLSKATLKLRKEAELRRSQKKS